MSKQLPVATYQLVRLIHVSQPALPSQLPPLYCNPSLVLRNLSQMMRSWTSATTSLKLFPIDSLGCCIWLRSAFSSSNNFPRYFSNPSCAIFSVSSRAQLHPQPSERYRPVLFAHLFAFEPQQDCRIADKVPHPFASFFFFSVVCFSSGIWFGGKCVAASLTTTPASRASASSERWMPVTTH